MESNPNVSVELGEVVEALLDQAKDMNLEMVVMRLGIQKLERERDAQAQRITELEQHFAVASAEAVPADTPS
jgi:muramoyltetrapeptide carboxypeptidase LdcA involved in peptidoglycan recycling